MQKTKFVVLVMFMVATLSALAQPICEDGCDVNDSCGDLAISAGLCDGSPTFFCEGEIVCVVNNSDPNSFDEWVVWWDDNDCDVYPNTIDTAIHIYDFSQDTCLNVNEGLEPVIFIKNIKYCGPGNQNFSLNCVATFLKIKVNPVANYASPNTLCGGQEGCFVNTTCANADTVFYEWFVDGVSVSTEVDLCHVFLDPGIQQVCLVATNECGSDTTWNSVSVRDVPVAISDFVYWDSIGCRPATVLLDDQSVDANEVYWEVLDPVEGWQFVSSSAEYPDTTIVFDSIGIFEIRHTAVNECGEDVSYLEIEIFDLPDVVIMPPDTACGELLYQPDVDYSGSIDSVEWFLEGADTSFSKDTIPEILLGSGIHEIQVVAKGRCGTDTASVMVIINDQDEVIFTPIGVLCRDSEPVQLEVTSINPGTFGCSNAVDESGLFDPSSAVLGVNIVCYEIVSALCPSIDSFEIIVQAADSVDVGGQEEVCIDAEIYQIVFSPQGGEWSGPGIIDSPELGHFDPMEAGEGDHTLTYCYEDPSGCKTIKTKVITVINTPELTGDDISICKVDQNFDLEVMANLNYAPGDGTLACWINGMEAPNCMFNPFELGTDNFDVIITYTIPSGCSKTDSFTLEVTELLQAEVPSDTIICKNQPLTLQGHPTGCGSWGPPPFISPSGVVNTTSFTGSKTFTYTCNEGTICETSAEVNITIEEGASIILLEDWVCISELSYSLPAGTPSTGVWSFSGTPVTGNSINVFGNLMENQDYTFTYTVEYLPDVCESVDFVLHVESEPTTAFAHPLVGCKDEGVSFTNNSMGATHYLWHFGDPDDSNSSETSPIFTYTIPDCYTVVLESWTIHPQTGAVLCSNTFSSEICISEPPQEVSLSADVNIGCAPLTVNFNNLSLGEDMEYEWNFGPNCPLFYGDIPPAKTFEQTNEEITYYDVILKGWNQCDTLLDTIQITVLPRPHAEFGIQFDEPCSGGELILNNLSTGNPENNLWTIRNITLNTEETFNMLLLPPIIVFAPETQIATVVIDLKVTNDCGESTFTDTIMVLPSPIDAIMSFPDDKVCVEDTLMLLNISTPGAIPRWEVVMSNNDTLFFNGDTLFFVPSIPGIFTVTLFAEGCGFDSEELDFEAMPLPDISVTYEPIVPCENQDVLFEVSSDGNGVTLYYGDDNYTNLHFSQHSYLSSATYFPHAVAETPLGCRSEWNGTIDIAERPEVFIAPTDSICVGTEVTYLADGTGAQSWEWLFCDTCRKEGESVNYEFLSSGNHIIELVGISPLGCRDTTERSIFVRPTPEADLEVEILKECTPAILVLQDQSTLATGIEWQLNGNSISTENTIEVTVTESGEPLVSLIATNGNICFDTASTILTLFETPTLSVSQDPSCSEAEGTRVSIETAEGNFVTMVGSGPGNFHPNVSSGEYLIEVVSPNGCEAELEVFVPPVQELFIGLTQYKFEIDLGREAQLEAFANQLNVTYQWAPAADLNDATIHDPVASPLISTFFAVAVTNEQGCVKLDTAFVEVNIDRDKGIFVPNTFTPNKDGINDIFRLRSVNPGLAIINSFQIFDRWGEKVFEDYDCEPETSTCGWDGIFRGQKAEMGAYVWLADLTFIDGISVKRKGDVMLVR